MSTTPPTDHDCVPEWTGSARTSGDGLGSTPNLLIPWRRSKARPRLPGRDRVPRHGFVTETSLTCLSCTARHAVLCVDELAWRQEQGDGGNGPRRPAAFLWINSADRSRCADIAPGEARACANRTPPAVRDDRSLRLPQAPVWQAAARRIWAAASAWCFPARSGGSVSGGRLAERTSWNKVSFAKAAARKP
jgi:hypothetical protein